MRIWTCYLLAFFLSGAQAAPRTDPARLLADVEALSAPAMEGRRTGTAGNERARAFIVERFRTLALRPLGESYEQKFTFDGIAAANLAGLVRGTAQPDEYLLVTAHYDHLGVRNGAVYRGASLSGPNERNRDEVASLPRPRLPRRMRICAHHQRGAYARARSGDSQSRAGSAPIDYPTRSGSAH